ncbi:hypothetical protein BDP27DRAFT_1429674 [Rhodocollybia butyracea]|uniref:Uncharacterized protein n=1 Tax=Rhodocollybia butyracea TaxID=206335 RepID=A0A9P5PCC9_9AGAR|nr:hypothetical protein BDP27DRAFT_1429674 [Rhodocollybia butyracea]
MADRATLKLCGSHCPRHSQYLLIFCSELLLKPAQQSYNFILIATNQKKIIMSGKNRAVRERRNAVIDLEISQHLPMNQLPPIQGLSSPSPIQLPSISQLMPPIHLPLPNSQIAAHQPAINPAPAYPPGLGPDLRRQKAHAPTCYTFSSSQVPAHLRVPGIVTSDEYLYGPQNLRKAPGSPSLHPLSKP